MKAAEDDGGGGGGDGETDDLDGLEDDFGATMSFESLLAQEKADAVLPLKHKYLQGERYD